MKYVKDTPRLEVKFIDPATNDLLFEIKGRDWMNVGELFADHHVNELMEQTIKKNNLPDNVTVLVVGNYNLM